MSNELLIYELWLNDYNNIIYENKWLKFIKSIFDEAGYNNVGSVHYNHVNILAQTRKEGNVLFNDTLNTFYLRIYGVTHMVKDQSDSERGNLLPPHRLLFPISSKGYFICIIPETG